MDGLVIKSTGSWCDVLSDDGRRVASRVKGKLRLAGIQTTNPVAVGDRVCIELEPKLDTGLITRIYPRRNYLIRKSVNLSKQAQIIAANLDQALLIVTLAAPRTSLGFIDRFLVTAEAYDIPITLVYNKLDLYDQESLEILAAHQSIYENIGYPCISISAKSGINMDHLEALLQSKTTLVTGHSGAGKSTLINRIIPKISLKTGRISDWSEKGKHTTTFAEMFTLPFGGYLIDTPGIQEWGIIDIGKNELGYFFPEMRQLLSQCKFHNCRHLTEPGCAVMQALETEKIALSRYDSYLSIYHENETRK